MANNKIEYRSLDLADNKYWDAEEMEKALNDMGTDGWDVLPFSQDIGTGTRLWFKRVVLDTERSE